MPKKRKPTVGDTVRVSTIDIVDGEEGGEPVERLVDAEVLRTYPAGQLDLRVLDGAEEPTLLLHVTEGKGPGQWRR